MARRDRHHSSLGPGGLALLAVLVVPHLGCGESKAEPETTGVAKVVYAVRQHTVVDGETVEINVSGGMGQVMDYKRYVPGGRLELLDLTTGDIDNIIEGETTADIASVDVSYDATNVLFSMKRDESDAYNLYWASLTPDDHGKFEIHQLTNSDFDQLHGIWLPGDRIAFISVDPKLGSLLKQAAARWAVCQSVERNGPPNSPRTAPRPVRDTWHGTPFTTGGQGPAALRGRSNRRGPSGGWHPG